jgi:glyoxylase-like metal-dependent hydrolase (beta-lactamase superfamily II)
MSMRRGPGPKQPRRTALSRREFLALASSVGAQVALMTAGPRPAWTGEGPKIVADEAWARIEQLAEGVWAVVSTPLAKDDWTTLSNGGIISGSDRVVTVEAYARTAGAKWVAERARELTGRWPTDVVVTHYHGDHANGLAGYGAEEERPQVWLTAKTLELIRENDIRRELPPRSVRADMLDAARILDPGRATELDLGGLSISLNPRRGHTASDVTVELDEPSVVFFGDLLWNRLFPNYRDTIPTAFSQSIREGLRERETSYIPGHGPRPAPGELESYLSLVEEIEAAGRRSFDKGVSPAEAAANFELPESVSDWTLFNDSYFEVAIRAWQEELGGSRQ